MDSNAAENEKGGGLRVTMITVAGTTTNDKRPKMTVETTCERNGCREMGTEDDNNKSSSASDLMQLEQQQNHHHPAASCFFTVPSSTGLTSSSTSVAMGTTANLAWKKATSLQPTKKLVIKPFKGGPKHKKTPTPQIPIKVPNPKSLVLLVVAKINKFGVVTRIANNSEILSSLGFECIVEEIAMLKRLQALQYLNESSDRSRSKEVADG